MAGATKSARPGPAVSPAHRLLVAVLRGDSDAAERATPAAWQSLLALADVHGIAALVASRLTAEPAMAALPPAETGDEARRRLRDAARLSFVLLQRVRSYGRQLAEDGIPAVALKGSALALTVYPSPEQRSFRDLDILVPRKRLGAARESLLRAGLRPAGGVGDAHFLEHHFHLPLLDSERLVVELHWGLVRPASAYRLAPEGVLTRARPLDGEPLLMESVEDQLLHAAAQCLSEGFSRLLRACDVDVILRERGSDIDWEGLALRAREGRLAPAVDTLIDIAGRLLGTPRPAGADLLATARSVRVGLDPHRIERIMLTRFTVTHRAHRHLLRFWLLPGARRRVFRHALCGHPFDRARDRAMGLPSGPGSRLVRAVKRALALLGLVGRQLWVMMRPRGDHLSLS
jgi:hypothetical protein